MENLVRRCDCDVSDAELFDVGGLTDVDTVDLPSGECCEAIYQFRKREIGRELSKEDLWDTEVGGCYSLGPGEQCGGSYGPGA